MKLILQAIKALFRKIEISLAQSLSHFKADMMGRIDSIQSTANTKMDAINPVGTGSFSMGREPGSVIGDCSHAEGYGNTASGMYSHAEGSSTTASDTCSHAEGCYTTASGMYSSHAEGFYTTASGMHSHAEGCYTTASSSWQHVQGQYNVEDSSNKYAHIVGNGTSSARSNAHTLDWNGVPWFKGRPQFGGAKQDHDSQTVMANGDKGIILKSSTANSTKRFKITVDDSGTISTAGDGGGGSTISLGLTGAAVGQIAKITAVDASGVPTAWSPVDMPDKLPNPNALTFTGAVTGSYDGSAPLSVNIPQGGGGGSVETYTGEYELIVDHTVTAEEASASSFTFTKDAYPLINGQKLLVLVIEMPDTVSMPWSVLKAGNDDVIWNSNGTANCIRGFSAVLYNRWFFKSEFLTNKNIDTYLPVTIAIIANRDPSFRSNPYKEYTSITLYSYVAFLAEGTVIKIYGGK